MNRWDDDDGGSNEIGVIIVAAYPSVRAGLRTLLENEPGIRVLAARADLADEDAPEPAGQPDALLIDVELGREELAERLARRYPEAARVLLLDGPEAYTPPGDDSARPYAALLRDAGGGEILAALRAVLRGLVVLDPAIARRLPRAAMVNARPDAEIEEPLTEREGEVLQLLSLGLPNKTIATRLGISEHTAKFHVGSILAKLGAASRTEAVTRAARKGLLVL